MSRPEVVLLVEPWADQERVRAVTLQHRVTRILERCHLADRSEWVREWVCSQDERALTGQRVFREVLPPPPPEEPERPRHDAIRLKQPLEWE